MLADTQVNVPVAYNADITSLDAKPPRGVYFNLLCLPQVGQLVSDHAWPVRWYQSGIAAGAYGTPGFGFSKVVADEAGKAWPPPAMKNGIGNQFTFTTNAMGELIVGDPEEVSFSTHTVTPNITQVASAGMASYSGGVLSFTAQGTNNPAYLALAIDTSSAAVFADQMAFNYRFDNLSPGGTNGALSVFLFDNVSNVWNRVTIEAGEVARNDGTNEDSGVIGFDGVPPGTNFVAFVFEAGDNDQASITVQDLSFSLSKVEFVPRLTATQSGGLLTLTWPTDVAGYRLQGTTNLIQPTWVDVPMSGTNSATVNLTGPQSFFRLVRP